MILQFCKMNSAVHDLSGLGGEPNIKGAYMSDSDLFELFPR